MQGRIVYSLKQRSNCIARGAMNCVAGSKVFHQMLGGAVIVAILSTATSGQAPAPSRHLDVDDIKLAESKGDWVSTGILPNGYIRIHNASLRKLLAVAYGISDNAVTGG